MNKRLLITTAVGLVLGTAAFAQAPSGTSSTSTPSAQSETKTSPAPSTATPSAQTAPSTSTGSTVQNQTPGTGTNSTSSQSAPSSTTTSQSSPSNTSTSNPAPSQAQTNSTTAPSQAQTNSPANINAPSQAQTNPPANAPSQVQTNPPANTPSQAQTNNPAPASNQAQQAPASRNNANTAAQTSNTNVNASVNINDQQRTRISQSVARLNVQPLTNVNFSLSVGTAVPRDVRIQTLPADVVEVVPQYRGYSFFMVRDEIVIVEPSSLKIVTVLPRSGGAAAAAPAPAQRKATFSDRDREVIRKHSSSRARSEVRTTGSTARTELRRGERVPDTVEIEAFPEEVYRESPSLREYRYINRENRTYVIEPRERTIIEEID